MKGILVDIIDEAVGKRLNLAVSHAGYPWKRAQNMVLLNQADAFITVPTKERCKYCVVTQESAIVFEIHILTRKNHPQITDLEKISSIQELADYKIADYVGNGWSKRVLKNMDVAWLPNIDAIFPFILLERADVVLASNRTLFRMKQQDFASKFLILPNTLDSVSFHICIGKKSSFRDRIGDINKTIREMHNDGTMDRIVEKYYH